MVKKESKEVGCKNGMRVVRGWGFGFREGDHIYHKPLFLFFKVLFIYFSLLVSPTWWGSALSHLSLMLIV